MENLNLTYVVCLLLVDGWAYFANHRIITDTMMRWSFGRCGELNIVMTYIVGMIFYR